MNQRTNQSKTIQHLLYPKPTVKFIVGFVV